MLTDPLANMLVQLTNAAKAKKPSVTLPYSQLKESVAAVLQEAGYITSYTKKGKKIKKSLGVELAMKDGQAKLVGAKRVSKPSRRVYYGVADIRRVKQGSGLLIISTPQGVMSGQAARKAKVGGEALCEIW